MVRVFELLEGKDDTRAVLSIELMNEKARLLLLSMGQRKWLQLARLLAITATIGCWATEKSYVICACARFSEGNGFVENMQCILGTS
ncbi:hypothetical protein HU200_055777 [Digitaria exilis]|uniref:Uncharacterized protein n=1 Tax=Digitaria exilis TaxID=1010633 RepID=A0A835AIT7_9POAL|nr:hypothetical protein HU200_055777 [Digitaria exilis]